MSTMAVYGKSEGEINGNTPLQPKTLYGESKLKAEKALEKIADENSTIIIETDNEEKVLNELKKIDIEIIDKRRYGRATLIFIKIRKG